MRRSYEGDAFRAEIFTHDKYTQDVVFYGPALFMVRSGSFRILAGDRSFTMSGDECIELFGGASVSISGRGNAAIGSADYDDHHVSSVSAVKPPIRHDKPWGFELEAPTANKRIQLKFLQVNDGHRTSLQYHEYKEEVMMFLDKLGSMEMVSPRAEHRVEGPKTYFEVSTYYPDDVVRVADDYGR